MNVVNLNEQPGREAFPGGKGRFAHSEHMTSSHWTLRAGAQLPGHAHPHEQISNIISGDFEFTVGGETKRLGPGMVLIIPPNARHSGRAISECYIVDVFYPVREDYR
jgi:quercetin dioxygenase-like cupin family protein